jgi:hypothetical protein
MLMPFLELRPFTFKRAGRPLFYLKIGLPSLLGQLHDPDMLLDQNFFPAASLQCPVSSVQCPGYQGRSLGIGLRSMALTGITSPDLLYNEMS